jgi:hypothetical protein
MLVMMKRMMKALIIGMMDAVKAKITCNPVKSQTTYTHDVSGHKFLKERMGPERL